MRKAVPPHARRASTPRVHSAPAPRVQPRWRRRERGQAFAEYAMVTSLLLVGFLLFGRSALVALLQAYQVYMESFYFVLSLPVP